MDEWVNPPAKRARKTKTRAQSATSVERRPSDQAEEESVPNAPALPREAHANDHV